MTGRRKEAELFIKTYIEKLGGTSNRKIYENIFSVMTDKDFDQFIKDIESGERYLVIMAPNFSDIRLDVEKNIEIGKELGYNFFQKLWVEGKEGCPTYQTPIPHLVIDLPIRRASQLLTKKISVPDDNKVIDVLTGQPTGASKGAKISYPELQLCSAMGLDNCMVELMKYRGGDNKGRAAFNAMLSRTGQVRLESIKAYSSGVESTKLVKTFLTSMMLKSTL